MSLSRIYQGRVTHLKLLDDKKALDAEAVPKQRLAEILGDHHAEFSRAVNYHKFQLLRLSTDKDSPLGKIRQRLIDADVATRRLRANDVTDEKERRKLQTLATHDIWNDFRRDGRRRPGMASSIAEALALPKDIPILEAFHKANDDFDDSGVSAEIYAAAVQALVTDLGGDGAIQQKGREYLPRFCDSAFSGSYPRSSSALSKKRVQAELPHRLHDPATADNLDALCRDLEFDHFANINPTGKPIDRERCLELFKEGIELLVAESGLAADDASRLLEKRSSLPESFALPAYRGASVKGVLRNRFFAFLVFKHLEASAVTFAVLRDTFPVPKTTKAPSAPKQEPSDLLRFGDDPVKLARGKKGMIYPGYTSLSEWGTTKPGAMGWKEFDIAAFKEALKAFNQVRGRDEERTAKLDQVKANLRYMESGGTPPKAKSGEDETDTEIVTFSGDDRFQRFQQLLTKLKTQAGDDADDYAAEDPRGLRFRAIRGRKDLFAAWNKALKKGLSRESDEDGRNTTLLGLLNEHQAEHRDDMGWSLLFRALCHEDHWGFWQEPTPEETASRRNANHSNDFLADYVAWSELLIDAERLAEPIRFSPADELNSRRLFMFSDACNFTPRGEFRHLPGAPAVIVPVAVKERGLFAKRRVRLDYSAPRLLRDGLRTGDSSENLAGALWNQPMMSALGVAEADVKQDISKAAVALMPDLTRSGELRFLLNFPLTLQEDGVIAKVVEKRGQSIDWSKQCVSFGKGADTQHFYLRWPGFDKDPKDKPWHELTRSFRLLSVDLGVRFAAASARLRAYAADAKEKDRDRQIRSSSGQDWFAQAERLISLRLPGEGRCSELHGDHENGRWATPDEIDLAKSIIFSLDLHPAHLGFEDKRYRIGEMGVKLIVALRRAIAHLRALHRWSCMDGDRWKTALEEIGGNKDREEKQTQAEKDQGRTAAVAEWGQILANLTDARSCSTEFEILRQKIKPALEQIANLLIPLRHGHWEWHEASSGLDGRPPNFELRQIDKPKGQSANRNRDQGGLSIKRIERISDFRKILQSFNRLAGFKAGQKPPTGREMRSHPLPDPCRALSDKLEAMKEQRVNQTAHLILAEALGLELKPSSRDKDEKAKLDLHGEYVSKRPPVDFIVIEDLARYRTTQGRTRQENSRLMQWCHRQISAKLKMLCEAYGILVIETPAAYSSRFCSLTGQPGFRAEELRKGDFFQDFFWKQVVQRAQKYPDIASSKAILAVRQAFEDLPEGSRKTLLLPRPGGGVFVPAGSGVCQNADLNAAVNLGLRAIAAPDRFDIHPRIRSEWKSGNYQTRETRNRFGPKPITISVRNLKTKDDGSAPDSLESRPNFFFVPGPAVPGFDIAEPDLPTKPAWPCRSGRALWKHVNDTVWRRVADFNTGM